MKGERTSPNLEETRSYKKHNNVRSMKKALAKNSFFKILTN